MPHNLKPWGLLPNLIMALVVASQLMQGSSCFHAVTVHSVDLRSMACVPLDN